MAEPKPQPQFSSPDENRKYVLIIGPINSKEEMQELRKRLIQQTRIPIKYAFACPEGRPS